MRTLVVSVVFMAATALIAGFAHRLLAAPAEPANANPAASSNGGGVLDVPIARLVADADLVISGPVPRSEAGLPIGNGRMGTLLWTDPAVLHMQINRVDVFANNKDTGSFPERHTDYCGGCAFVDLDAGSDVFTDRMTQRLSCNDGVATIEGDGLHVRALAWTDRDVIALEISDNRPNPNDIRVRLRMLRPPVVKHFQHTATSTITERSDSLWLSQEFQEGDYFCGSAVAVRVLDRKSRIERTDEKESALVVDGGSGTFTVLVSSAASDNPNIITGAALHQLDDAAARKFDGLLAANRAWWSNFWRRGFVSLHSDDGKADDVQRHYLYYLYLMGSTSRGKYPTKFNGMLWTTGGDPRQWGSQYWGANQSCIYNALLPSNRLELLDPMFDMYTGMLDSCAVAARQQWGSQGVFLPEVFGFDGLAELPDDIAAEMRDLYLVRKPMTEATPAFLEFARMKMPHSSRWNWWLRGKTQDGVWQPEKRPEAPFGAVTHIFSRGAKVAYTFWQRYEYTLDEAWLRDRAYPVLRGVAEFYRNFPNMVRGADGKYHIHHVNSNESVRDASDTDEEIASMRGVFPALIRASEILNVDADMRPVWQEFLDNLAPLPRSDNPEVVKFREESARRRAAEGGAGGGRRGGGNAATSDGRPTWVRGLPPVRSGGLGRPDGNTMPIWFFDLCTLENPDQETMAIANATLDGYGGRGGGVLTKVGVVNAMMGRSDAVSVMIPAQLATPDRAPVLANRMDQREGQQTTSAQRLGRAADALHNALVQSVGAGPAADPVIRVFPACPADWDAAFTLLCRGGFLVTSSQRGGKVEFIAIESQMGGPCRVRNPWGEGDVSLNRSGAAPITLSGSLLQFETAKGERTVIAPQGVAIDQLWAHFQARQEGQPRR